jgi:hypothetical protein
MLASSPCILRIHNAAYVVLLIYRVTRGGLIEVAKDAISCSELGKMMKSVSNGIRNG